MKVDKKKGFTLLEVIVALAITGTAIIAIFSVLRTCATASRHGRMLTAAVLLAQSKLTESMLEDNPAYETQTGISGQMSWQLRTTPTTIDNLATLEVAVTWNEQLRPQRYELLTLRKMKVFTENE